MIVEKVIQLNSNTVMARVHKDNFIDEITEIEKVAEVSGVYGRVSGYSVEKNASYYDILFSVV